MFTCQVSAAQLLCASSAKHQTLALGKPVLRARLFRHFPGEGSVPGPQFPDDCPLSAPPSTRFTQNLGFCRPASPARFDVTALL